jgi:hypothetical protein
MESSEYKQLTRRFCEAVGIQDAAALADGGHVVVDENVVGLVHDADDVHSGRLSIYAELDSVDPTTDTAMWLRLLQANVCRLSGLQGHFGVHPETGRAVYCFDVNDASGMQGAELADIVISQVRAASAALPVLMFA